MVDCYYLWWRGDCGVNICLIISQQPSQPVSSVTGGAVLVRASARHQVRLQHRTLSLARTGGLAVSPRPLSLLHCLSVRLCDQTISPISSPVKSPVQ